MAKPVKHVQRKGGKPSPVNQSAARGGDVIERLRQQAAGLLQPRQSMYMDMTHADPDNFIEAMNLVVDVKRRFAALPSRLRAECQNDPRQFLRLANTAAQGDEVAVSVLKKFGLSVTPPKPPAPVPDPAQQDLVKQAENPPPLEVKP